jgi:hypothetical protein
MVPDDSFEVAGDEVVAEPGVVAGTVRQHHAAVSDQDVRLTLLRIPLNLRTAQLIGPVWDAGARIESFTEPAIVWTVTDRDPPGPMAGPLIGLLRWLKTDRRGLAKPGQWRNTHRGRSSAATYLRLNNG